MVVAEVDGGYTVANNDLCCRVVFADYCCIADAVCNSWTSFHSLMDNDQTILPNYDSPDESNLDVDVNNYDYIVDHNCDSCGNLIFLVDVVDGADDDKDFHGKMGADIGCVKEYDDD